MNLTEKLIWAELRYKLLESAVMINDGYPKDEVIKHLMDLITFLENTEPIGGE